MQISLWISAALASGGLMMGAQPDFTQLPEGHPQVGPDKEAAPARPPAKPEDVKSQDAIVDAFFDCISGPVGEERDWNRFNSLFHEKAQMIASRPSPDGAGLWIMSPDQFAKLNGAYLTQRGYTENALARRTESFGNIAHVWCSYEALSEGQLKPDSRGIYSIQLLKDGDRWWIVNMYWDYERDGNPIPDTYLVDPS